MSYNGNFKDSCTILMAADGFTSGILQEVRTEHLFLVFRSEGDGSRLIHKWHMYYKKYELNTSF